MVGLKLQKKKLYIYIYIYIYSNGIDFYNMVKPQSIPSLYIQ